VAVVVVKKHRAAPATKVAIHLQRVMRGVKAVLLAVKALQITVAVVAEVIPTLLAKQLAAPQVAVHLTVL
jgi:hypothetical protein